MLDIECLVTIFVAGPESHCVSAASLSVQAERQQLEGPDWCASFQTPELLRAFLSEKMRLSSGRVREIMGYVARGESFTFIEKLQQKALEAVRRKDPKWKRRRALGVRD